MSVLRERAPLVTTGQAIPQSETVRERPIQWVKLWAGIGLCVAALALYSISRWLLLGHATPAPRGDTSSVTSLQWFWVRFNEVLSMTIAAFVVWRCVLRPWRRAGHLTWDGLFVLAWTCSWFQDPLANFQRVWFHYSSLFFNLGCWQCHVPGWIPPHGDRFSEPIFFLVGAWAGLLPAWCIATNWLMRKAKRRWPHLGKVGLVGVAFVASVAFDFVVELAFLRMGLYTFDGAIQSWSVFGGHVYQLPIYEPIAMGALWAAASSLRYFRNDKGQSVAELGIDDIRAPSKRKTALRFLSIYGALNVIVLATYTVPTALVSLHGDERPADSYVDHLTNQMCGPGTDHACPGPKIPLPLGPRTAHISPDGKLIIPDGLPTPVGR